MCLENSQENFTGDSLIYWCQAIIFQKKSVGKVEIMLSSSFDSSIQPNIYWPPITYKFFWAWWGDHNNKNIGFPSG